MYTRRARGRGWRRGEREKGRREDQKRPGNNQQQQQWSGREEEGRPRAVEVRLRMRLLSPRLASCLRLLPSSPATEHDVRLQFHRQLYISRSAAGETDDRLSKYYSFPVPLPRLSRGCSLPRRHWLPDCVFQIDTFNYNASAN